MKKVEKKGKEKCKEKEKKIKEEETGEKHLFAKIYGAQNIWGQQALVGPQ